VERNNVTIRQHARCLGRKVHAFPKEHTYLEHQLALSCAYSHFVVPHRGLRQRLAHPPPWVGSSLQRWVQHTSAVAAGFIDHIWTVDELWSFRVPPRCVWLSTPHRSYCNVPHERDTTERCAAGPWCQCQTIAEVEAALGTLDTTALPRATIAALRLADRLSDVRPHIDAEFYAELRQALDEDEILALGAALSLAAGWQRFIEAFGMRPDGWTATTPLP